MTLADQLRDEVKKALRAGDKPRVSVLRMALAAVKQREIDERITLDDAAIVSVLHKMIKQRHDSRTQFAAGGRNDLADKEAFEIEVLNAFLPAPLDASEIESIVAAAIAETGATGMRDMGRVIGIVRTAVAGRADMGKVSAMVKARLSPS